MDPIELYDLLHKRPFQPFRVHLNDGRIFDIRYPYMNMVGVTWIRIGVLTPGDTASLPIPDHSVKVPLLLISKVEPLLDAPLFTEPLET